MLQTTVSYLNLLENKRHNLVSEKQNDYQLSLNARDVAVHEGQLIEIKRHNSVTEEQGWASIFEIQRHNRATEDISMYDAATRRMQIPINQQQADAATMNAMTNRYSAEQQAGIGWANVAISRENMEIYDRKTTNDFLNATNNWGVNTSNAAVNQYNAQTNRMNYDWNVTYGTGQLEIGQQNANTNEYNAQTNRLDTVWRNLLKSIEMGSKAIPSVLPGGFWNSIVPSL